jgi:hypothetical protein
VLIWPGSLLADTLRFATWHVDLSRKGPGLLLRDVMRDEVAPVLEHIAEARPDVLLLTDIDYDHGLVGLGAMQGALSELGLDLPHAFALRPNTGMPTGLDMDGDGLLGGPRDAQGYGWFSGQGGQAVLSRYPVTLRADLSDLLWWDAPDSLMQAGDTGPEVQRLSTSAHWALQVDTPQGAVQILTLAATPPLFDGPEDRNGRRNRDEVLLWLHSLDGTLPGYRSDRPMVLMGNLNLDPDKADGLRSAVQQVLGHPGLQDPLPGQPTVTWSGPGDMRVSYILPSADLTVVEAGVTLPVQEGGPHRLVWVDLALPTEPAQSPVASPLPGPSP